MNMTGRTGSSGSAIPHAPIWKKNGYEGDAAIHNGNHGPEYIKELTIRLQKADIEAGGDKKNAFMIEDALSKTRSDLLNGILKLNKGD